MRHDGRPLGQGRTGVRLSIAHELLLLGCDPIPVSGRAAEIQGWCSDQALVQWQWVIGG